MSFVASTDKWPILLNSSGLPLSWGRLYYTQVDTVSVPKAVYSDIARTIPFSGGLVECGAEGRTSSQVFLGIGEYTVISHRFVGTDVLTAEPSDWVPDNQWKEYGLADHGAMITSKYTTVDTIADLRLVDPAAYSSVRVLGYYAFDDMFPRTYHAIASGMSDNGGTYITGAGTWRLAPSDATATDCRIFGVFSDTGFDCSHTLGVMDSALTGGTTARSIYFPPGIYTTDHSIYMTNPVIFDRGCQFYNTSAVPATFTVARGSENRGISGFCAPGSTGDIDLVFKCGATVKPEWWHYEDDGADWAPAWERMVASTDITDYVIVSKPMALTNLSGPSTTSGRFHFQDTGSLALNGGAHPIYFVGPGSISIAEGCIAPLRGPYVSMLRFPRYHSIRASWFANPADASTTMNLSPIVAGANGTATYGCKFIFDMPTSLFGTNLAAADASSFVFTWESGKAYTAPGIAVHLPRSVLGPGLALTGGGFILGTTSYARNFAAPDFTTAEQSAAFHHALNSAVRGSGELDMCGLTLEVESQYDLPVGVSIARLLVHSGGVKPLGALSVIRVVGDCARISLENLAVTGGDGSCVIEVAGGTVARLYLAGVSFTAPSISAVSSMVRGASGTFGKVSIHDCSCVANNIVASYAGGLYDLNLSANPYLQGSLEVDDCCLLANNNKVAGGTWDFSCYQGAILSGNRFYGTGMNVRDNLAQIDAVVYGNQFESPHETKKTLNFEARSLVTCFAGANVFANSFTGSRDTQHVVITASGTFATKADPGKYHRVCMANNQSGNLYTLVPLTRGSPDFGRSYVEIAAGATVLEASVDHVILGENPGIFYLPESQEMGTVHSLSAARRRGVPGAWMVQSQAWSGKLRTGEGIVDVAYVPASFGDVNVPAPFTGQWRSEIVVDLY